MTDLQARLYSVIIPKERLLDGCYYAGRCRNAHIARWSANTGRFFHWRYKFGREFIEEIDYFTPDGQWDEFIPVIDLGPELPREIPFTVAGL